MKRLIIADILSNNVNGKCVGHYFAVADNYKQIFSDTDVFIAGGPIYRSHYGPDRLIDLPYDYISGSSLLLKPIRSIINCWNLLRKTNKDDVVIMQQSADLAMILGVALFAKKEHNIYVIQYSNQPMQSRFRRFVYQNFTRKKLKGTICTSKELGELYGTPYIVVPDYISANDDYNSNCEKIYDFSVIGRLNRDKGVVQVVDKLKNSKLKVLIAGKPDDTEYETLIRKAYNGSSNIEILLDYITMENYDNLIRQSKFCILNYQEEYSRRSSGVVYDVVFRGTPIVGKRCKSLAFVEEEKIGVLYDDIKDYDFDKLISSDSYRCYSQGISAYKSKHQQYMVQLRNFVISEK